MTLSKEKLMAEAAVTGYRSDVLEKVILLLNLLETLGGHPFLKGRLALKGGTALNLFFSDIPRLSVDIDLNYIGAIDKEIMISEKPNFYASIEAVCQREGFSLRRYPEENAGGKMSLRYHSAMYQGGNLEIDVNFMFRESLWPLVYRDSLPVGSFKAVNIPVLDYHELAAGKLVAMLARHTSRDLFDSHRILKRGGLDSQRLRLAFVVYGGINRKDWRMVAAEDVDFDERELQQQLLPLLSEGAVRDMGTESGWARRLVEECRDALGIVLPLQDHEREFLDRLLDHGQIKPSILTKDAELIKRIQRHPGLEWKALNVRQFKGK